MIKFGSSLLIVASLLWLFAYIGIIFQSFVLFIFAIALAAVGAITLLAGVYKDRLKEKEEEENHDYREY